MKRLNFIKLLMISFVLIVIPIFSFCNSSDKSSKTVFKDGETVCFIGASTTHNGVWHNYISNYFVTRFPKIKTRFVNCGISGDVAGGVLKRLQDDILPNKPNHAVILIGLNDVHRELYDTDSPSSENLAKRRAAFERYRSDIGKIINELKNNGCHSVILVSTSPYDETALIDKSNLIKVNDELGVYAETLRELAKKQDVRFVDFHGPMTKLTLQMQQTDPKFTFAPRDRIHPGDLGNQYMAYLFLEALKVPELVSEVSIVYNELSSNKSRNAELSMLEFGENKLSFDLLEQALPYPIKKDIPAIFKMVPIEDDLNRQVLQIKSLPHGNWAVKIDGTIVGKYLSEDLNKGINLSGNSNTPQFIQAQKVMDTNFEYFLQECKPRDYVKVGIMLREKNIDLDNDTEIKSYFETFPKTEGKYAEAYFTELFSRYFDNKRNLITDKQKLESLFLQLYSGNQPVKHHYEIFKI